MGLVISGYSASGVISGLIMGYISDQVQRSKIFFLVSILMAAIGHFIYFIGISKYVILIGRIISGVCLGAGTVALAYIAKTTNEKQRTSVISIVMATRQFGLMFGPAFNLFLRKLNFKLFNQFEVNRKSAPGLFMAIIWSLCFLVILVFYRDRKSEGPKKVRKNEAKEEKTEFLEDKTEDVLQIEKLSFRKKQKEFLRVEIFVLLTVTFFTYFNQTSLETIVTPFTEIMFGWGELENSILFCIGGGIIIISYVLIRILSMKISDRYILLIGVVCIFIGLVIGCACLPFASQLQNPIRKSEYKESKLIMNLTSSIVNETGNQTKELVVEKPAHDYQFFPSFVIFVVLDVLGLPAIAITSASLFTKLIDNKVQGLGQGYQRGVLGIGMIIGPLSAGPLVQKPLVLIGISLCFITFILILVVVSFKRLKPKSTAR